MNDRVRFALRYGLVVASALLSSSADAQVLKRHFYWVDEGSSLTALRAQADHVDVVSPQWFWVDQDGQVTGSVEPGLIELADEKKLPLMPLVGNQGFRADVARSVLDEPATARRLVRSLVMNCLAYGFTGLQLDFEGMSPESRAPYAAFLEQLGEELRRNDLLLSVALGSPLGPRPLQPGDESTDPAHWPASDHAATLDYARIAAAADWVTLMTYDQHTQSSGPGPVAGLPWVEASVRRALEWVPAEKLMLGISLYHRRWSGEEVSEGSHAEALALAAGSGAEVAVDPLEYEKRFRFVRGGVQNVVWLQDAETLSDRVALARRLGLAGYSAWRLGHEDPAAWQRGPLGRRRR